MKERRKYGASRWQLITVILHVFLGILLTNGSDARSQTLPSPASPSKEYIYAGERMVTIEEPAAGSPAEGSSATVTISTPGTTASLAFQGTAGQRISLKGSNVSISGSGWSYVSVIKPDGTTLTGGWVNNWVFFFDVQILAVTGTYTILVDPENNNTGSMTLTLYGVPPDFTGTITPGGSPVTITTTTPGQNASLTFSGTAGQRISLKTGSGTLSNTGWNQVVIKNPDGSWLNWGWMNNWTGFLDVRTLPTTGTYTVSVDPESFNVGGLTLTLYDVPPDPTGTIIPGGLPVTITTTTPGQNASLAFSGTAGQRISLKTGSGTISNTGWSHIVIQNPDGSWLNWGWVNNGTAFFDVRTLPTTGTYTIWVDPESFNVGGLTLTLYDVIDVTGIIVIGGPSVPISITTPGQNARLIFIGATGQQVSLTITG
ncbi:MAG: hypothetical protein L0338_35495, partial [Acidobacteria bacterium]|nr:hypothetical protein [Acidobacteriota bacterium]